MESGGVGTARQFARTAPPGPVARTCAPHVRRPPGIPSLDDRPGPAGGWSTGYIATPRTLKTALLNERYENHFLPAFVKGLSPRPAPATAPIVARQSG